MLTCGFSQRKINPAPGSSIPGDFLPPVSLGVHDDLMTKVAYFSDGKKSVLIAVADFVEMFREEALPIRKFLSEHTGIALDAIMFCGTHTHSGGMVLGFPPFTYTKTDHAYVTFIQNMTLEAALEAIRKAEPVKIGFAVGKEENVSFNRRYFMKDGTVKTWPGFKNPDAVKAEGTHDPDVAVLRVDRMNGEPLGLITNFACHATAHHENYFSADYPTGIAQAINAALGDGVFSLFINGACGNVTHIDWEERVFTREELSRPDHHIRIGRMVGFEALKTRELVRYMDMDAVHVDYSMETLAIERRLPSKKEYDEAMNYLKTEGAKKPADEYYAASIQYMYENPDKDQPMPADVQVVSVGGVRICAFPAELFYEYAVQLKNAEKGENIMIATIANGVLGYVPTSRAFVHGGYENSLGFTSNSEEACGDKLIQSALRQIEIMKRTE